MEGPAQDCYDRPLDRNNVATDLRVDLGVTRRLLCVFADAASPLNGIAVADLFVFAGDRRLSDAKRETFVFTYQEPVESVVHRYDRWLDTQIPRALSAISESL